MKTENKKVELEEELEKSKKRASELHEQIDFLKQQNTALVRKSIDLSDLQKQQENINFDLITVQKELKHQNIQLVKKSVELSDVMRQLEDKNHDLKQLQTTLEDVVISRTIALRETNAQLRLEIQERSEAQKALLESEKKYKSFFNNTGTAIMIIEEDMIASMVNARIEELSGYTVDEIQGKMKWTEFVADKEHLETMKLYHRKRREDSDHNIPKEYEFLFLHKDGSTKEVMVTIDIEPEHGRSIASMIDITSLRDAERKQKKLEDQLRQAQKMESIGLLAGGIAHDFNNILAAIMGYIEMSKNSALEGSSIKRWLSQALSACDRAKELIVQILTFSRQHEQKQILINPAPIVREALKFLRASIPTTISFDIKINNQCGNIMGDPTQFHQIIMNICTNAVHAMPGNSGVISVSLDSISGEDSEVQHFDIEDTSAFVKLSISDTGQGMEKTVLDRIFEPFFTTKKMGEGTGMGLAVTHGIIKSFNGESVVESEKEKGTKFNIYFPLIAQNLVANKEHTSIIQGGTERILLVDDDQDLLEMLHELVESLGYHVSSYADSIQAGEVFCENPDDFDLVITDQTMPGMTGSELARLVLDKRRETPVVLCTGYNDSIAPEIAEAIGISEFLSKPVKRNKLAEIIRNLLGN